MAKQATLHKENCCQCQTYVNPGRGSSPPLEWFSILFVCRLSAVVNGRITVDENDVKALLDSVRDGTLEPGEALGRLKILPYQRSRDVNIDNHRRLRRGLPEVVFAQGKSDAQLVEAVLAALGGDGSCIVTRVSDEQATLIREKVDPDAIHSIDARMVIIQKVPEPDRGRGTVLVVTAGTSDVPVAEEAAVTCEALGNRVCRTYDVGVAGLHRLLENLGAIQEASVIIAVAGMEGALPSVVAGLAPCPVIAVPTSIGYGASLGGIAALLAMLNSCAGGVTVVNIDNGFGAGVAASLINRRRPFDPAAVTE